MAEYKSKEEYDKANTIRYSIKLNRNTDIDLIKWLNGEENKQGAIKRALEYYTKTAASTNDPS